MDTTLHLAPSGSRARRWLNLLMAASMAATGILVAGAASPAQASGSFCDTAKSVYSGVYANANLIMPANSGIDSINCSMSQGATGGGVTALQWALNRCYGGNLSVDGQFGPRTRAALIRAQQQHGFTSGLGRYTDREAWNLRFMAVRGVHLVCARMEGAILS